MSTYRATGSTVIEAPAGRVYAILADYREGHPGILPRPPFQTLVVEQGGVGAGTIVSFSLRVFGRERAMRARIDEPEPGRVLTETDLDSGIVTTFTIEALGPDRSRATIQTTGTTGSGLAGSLERFMTVSFLEQTYKRELQLLAEAAISRGA